MAAGGSIVLVASQKGLCGSTGSLAYNASKGGMIIMARSMALELGSRGIRVNCVCPGPTETPMFAQEDVYKRQPHRQPYWRHTGFLRAAERFPELYPVRHCRIRRRS